MGSLAHVISLYGSQLKYMYLCVYAYTYMCVYTYHIFFKKCMVFLTVEFCSVPCTSLPPNLKFENLTNSWVYFSVLDSMRNLPLQLLFKVASFPFQTLCRLCLKSGGHVIRIWFGKMQVSYSKPVQVLTPENSTFVKNLFTQKSVGSCRDLIGSLHCTLGEGLCEVCSFLGTICEISMWLITEEVI